MSIASKAAAADFIKNETQFHLGFLPTEQSHPRSVDLEKNFKRSSIEGVKTLQNIDRDVLVMAQKVLKSREFERFVNTAKETSSNGGRMIFSGCGATGRLAILLESMWRDAASRIEKLSPFADNAASIMTGGDYALVRAVEFFEDYPQFGRKQVEELAVNDKDMLIAITEAVKPVPFWVRLPKPLNAAQKVFCFSTTRRIFLLKNLNAPAKRSQMKESPSLT